MWSKPKAVTLFNTNSDSFNERNVSEQLPDISPCHVQGKYKLTVLYVLGKIGRVFYDEFLSSYRCQYWNKNLSTL